MVHSGDQVRGNCFTGLVVLCEALQDRGIIEHFFKHLGWGFHEIEFRSDSALAGPPLPAAQHFVRHVPEFVKKRNDLIELHETWIIRRAA